MLQKAPINLGRVLLALSDALDLCSPRLASHQLRTAYIATETGRALGMSKESLAGLFMASSLHDVGALNSTRKVEIVTGAQEEMDHHAMVGETLFRSIPLFAPLAPVIRHHHTSARDLGALFGDPIKLSAHALYAADFLERSIDRDVFILKQSHGLMEKLKSQSAGDIHPEVVDALLELGKREEFWLDIISPRLEDLLIQHGNYETIPSDTQNMRQISALFRNLIDFRSHFTATHSTGVAHAAMMLATLFGLSESEVEKMEIAGSFHDLGKLVVPNEILEKPGGLEHDEFAVMRQHTYWTYTLLNPIGGFGQVSEWAAFHHERLDGTGYPFHLGEESLSAGARIMAVADVTTAIMEDRPYRKGMSDEKVKGVLQNFANRGALAPNIVELLLDNYGEVSGEVREKQSKAMAFYRDEIAGI